MRQNGDTRVTDREGDAFDLENIPPLIMSWELRDVANIMQIRGVALNARFLDAELYNHSIKYKITSVEGYVVGCINYLVILSTFNTIQPSNPIMSVSKVYHQNLI